MKVLNIVNKTGFVFVNKPSKAGNVFTRQEIFEILKVNSVQEAFEKFRPENCFEVIIETQDDDSILREHSGSMLYQGFSAKNGDLVLDIEIEKGTGITIDIHVLEDEINLIYTINTL